MAQTEFVERVIEMPEVLHVLVFRGERRWVAQCLQYDIAAQAEDLGELLPRFQKTLEAEKMLCIKHGRVPLTSRPRAPQKYWDEAKKLAAISMSDAPERVQELSALWRLPNPESSPAQALL